LSITAGEEVNDNPEDDDLQEQLVEVASTEKKPKRNYANDMKSRTQMDFNDTKKSPGRNTPTRLIVKKPLEYQWQK